MDRKRGINEKICKCITDRMRVDESFSADESQIIKYMVITLISETEKIVLLLTVFMIFGEVFPFLMMLSAVFLTHPFTGGAHRETFWGCFFQSFLFFCATLFLGKMLPLSSKYLPFICIGSIIIYAAFVPTTSEKRGIYGKKSKKRIKIIAAIGMLIVCIISRIFIDFYPYLMWVIILENLELLAINLFKEVIVSHND